MLAVRLRRRTWPRYLKATGREAIADAADARRRRPAARPRGRWPTRARSTTRSSRSTSTSSSRSSTARTPPTSTAPGRARSAPTRRGEGLAARDLGRARRLVHQLVVRGHHPRRVDRPPGRRPRASRAKTQLLITPGSEQVRATIERDGLLADLEAIGATVLANACGPCIGQWERADIDPGDGQHDRQLVQPQLPEAQRRHRPTRWRSSPRPRRSIALALAGTLDFDPHDRHAHQRRRRARCSSSAPVGEELPDEGLRPRRDAASSPRPADGSRRRGRGVARPATGCSCSSRSPPWDGSDYVDLPVLMKAQGKCTTDHISAAGQWLKYRGHLENISRQPVPRRRSTRSPARPARARTSSTARPGRSPTSPSTTTRPASAGCAIGDENYGEGSSREHAAMEPRFRNGQGRSSPAASPASTRRT